MTEINCYIGFSGLPTYGTSRYIIMSTPASKRLNTEMSFSPETHTVIDKKEWHSILSDLLEEKFETYGGGVGGVGGWGWGGGGLFGVCIICC